ncbi:hypothetical protein [Paenibacillus hubeiensis]|uniref:hypothetical protein n=1 Tax=Paenibacillus hubeiensis TaxID=3077330 RepID=UPI0031BA76F9
MQIGRKVIVSLVACLLFIPSVVSAKEAQLKAPAVKTVKAKKIYPPIEGEGVKQKAEGDGAMAGEVILKPLQTLMDEHRLNETEEKIEVNIMLKYDLNISKKHFLKTKFSAFKDAITDQEGFGGYSFFAELTIKEIEEVSTWDAVSTISLPSDTVSIY